jgi:hypothetical protein
VSWFIEEKEGFRFVYHAGGDDGFRTNLVLAPDQDMALVWMCNSLYPGATLPQKVTHEFVLLLKETAAK